MKQKQFVEETTYWLDRFISENDRDPKTYQEFIQFCMDTLTDEGKI